MSKVIQLSRSEAWLHTWGFGWNNSYLTTPHSLLSLGLVIYSFFSIPSAPHIANTPVLKHTEAHIDTVLHSFLSDLLSPSTLHALKPTLSQERHNLSVHHELGKEDPRLRGQIICEAQRSDHLWMNTGFSTYELWHVGRLHFFLEIQLLTSFL